MQAFKYMGDWVDNSDMTKNIHRGAASTDPSPQQAIEPIVQSEYELVSALRQGTWQLLDRYSGRAGSKPDASVIVGLQDVANRLGALERVLQEQHSPRASAAAAA
jgi:hypothetical protein